MSAKKILIVEDQQGIRELIRMTLEMDAFDIHEAANGEQGLRSAQALRPDLLLLDVMMPGALNGLQVCEAIRRDPALKRTKVLMLSARGQAQDRQAGTAAGADEYLVKPFSPIALMDVINRLIG